MRQALSILAPLGWLYGLGALLRRTAYARGVFGSERLLSPVISVGGLAMGGSMKTPLVLELARALHQRGPAVGVIGHGYRGTDQAARVVSDGANLLEPAERVGDEAVLLACELPGCPLVVGKDKVAAGRLLEARFGKRIVLVDSGFQHLRLARDLDLVCVSERDLGDRVLPSGQLRETTRVLQRADLVFTDQRSDGPRIAKLRAQRPDDVFSMARSDFAFFPAEGTGDRQDPPQKAFALCAIGRPQRFVDDLRAQGSEVVGHRFFRDHHPFSDADLEEVARLALGLGAAAVVTTAKDAVRVKAWPRTIPFLVLSARLHIEDLPRVLKRIDRAILAHMKAARS